MHYYNYLVICYALSAFVLVGEARVPTQAGYMSRTGSCAVSRVMEQDGCHLIVASLTLLHVVAL